MLFIKLKRKENIQNIGKKFWKKIDTKPTFRVYQNTYSKRVIYEKVKNNIRFRI